MGRKKNPPAGGEKDNKEDEKGAKKLPGFNIASDAKRSVAAVFLFALALIIILGFFDKAGMAGESLNKLTGRIIGWAKLIFPLFLIAAGVIMLLRKETSFYVSKLLGLLVTLVGVAGLMHWIYGIIYGAGEMKAAAASGAGGGYLGYAVANFAIKYMGQAGGLVIIVAFFLIGFIIAFNFSIIHFLAKFFSKKPASSADGEKEESEAIELAGPAEEKDKAPDQLAVPVASKEIPKSKEDENIGKIEFVEGPDRFDENLASGIERREFRVKNGVRRKNLIDGIDSNNLENSDWVFPPADLLSKSSGGADGGDVEKNADTIEKTLRHFGIEVERGGIQIGPAVTQYSFRPAVGVKVAQILALQNDLSLALALHPIRIEAPIPGKALFGVEVPNKTPADVRLGGIIESDKFKFRESNLTLALGEDVSGELITADLGIMPHLMIAGATGTGKSVAINSIITTLLYQNSPDDLKFIMVDPKRVELSFYEGIPHLLSSVITENAKVINALKWVVGEMERRYRLLQDMKSQNIDSYNEKFSKGHKRKYTDPDSGEVSEESMEKLPFIVVVIDELADLMMSHGKEIEGAISRIAQMARAVGIHLIVSTQRPEVKIITGLIKANINSRIAFKVNTQVDSRTILDMAGAEKLLGKGDMLYLSAGTAKPKRIKGVFVSEGEVKKVVKFIKEHNKKKEEIGEDITRSLNGSLVKFNDESGDGQGDDLYAMAKEEALRAGKVSASFLQRRLRVGYARAARLLDILEENGVIGPADGAKPREVFGANPPAGGPQEAINYESPAEDQTERDKWQM